MRVLHGRPRRLLDARTRPQIDHASAVAGRFSSAVVARVDRLPQPVMTRIERFFRRQLESVGFGFAWGGAVAAVAVVTIILMTPYAREFANRGPDSSHFDRQGRARTPRRRKIRWRTRRPASLQWRTTILTPTSLASSRRTILLQFGASPAGTRRSFGYRISLRSP